MNKLMIVAAAGLALAGCQMFEEELPENCVVIEEVKPAEPGRVEIDTTMVVHDYPVMGSFMERMGSYSSDVKVVKSEIVATENDEDRDWKYFFAQGSGCTWPVGSSCFYVKCIGKLRIRNTEENHAIIRKLLEELNTDQVLCEVQVRFVKVAQSTLDAVGEKMLPGKEKDRRYDLADFETVPAKDLERLLISRRDLVANDAQKVLTKPGEEAVVKSVTEYIYPTDYDVQMGEMQPCGSNETAKVRSCGIATVEPQSFTMREVGTILDVTPFLTDNGRLVDLRINTQVVNPPEWQEFGMDLPSPNGGSYRLPMKQPFFPVRSIDTSHTLNPGGTVLAGSVVKSGKDSDITELIFVTARVLDTNGREKKPAAQ